MGTLILIILAMGAFTIYQWMIDFITPFIKVKQKAALHAMASETEERWAGFDKPAFIRRGIPYPQLTVKKRVRARKAKIVLAAV
jgi:hypothetical protein